jgi:hypothetical protein
VRTFKTENGEKAVHHDYFSIPKDLQGKGLSKKVFKALYKQYRNAGVTKMDVYANIDVGGYTWARYGFTASQADVKRILDKGGIAPDDMNIAESIVSDFFKVNPPNTLFPMNLLTGKTWSEKLLKGKYWYGFLDLKNKTQRDVFENYINW